MSFNQPGQGWVGWRNDTRNNRPVEIIFEFDKIREFSSVTIYTNNQFTKDVQVFNETKIFFSVGGKRYKGEPITYDSFEDRIMETAHNVTIKLHHRVGRFVKLQLFFASRWILISEVSFESSPVNGNFTEEDDVSEVNHASSDNIVNLSGDQKVISVVNSSNGFGQNLGIIVGLFSVLGLFILFIVGFLLYQHRRYKSSPRPSQIPDKTALYRTPSLGKLPKHFVLNTLIERHFYCRAFDKHLIRLRRLRGAVATMPAENSTRFAGFLPQAASRAASGTALCRHRRVPATVYSTTSTPKHAAPFGSTAAATPLRTRQDLHRALN